jgi:hypothetical protein
MGEITHLAPASMLGGSADAHWSPPKLASLQSVPEEGGKDAEGFERHSV